jgi:hypothetical protein
MDGRVGQQNVVIAALAALLLSSCNTQSPEEALRESLAKQSMGVIRLPAGDIVISAPIVIPANALDMELRGSATTRILAAPDFEGRALIIVEKAKNVTFADFVLDGNREALGKPLEMAPPENAFRVWYPNNGILVDQTEGLRVERVTFVNVAQFPLIVSRSSGVRVQGVTVRDSGGMNAKGRNNLSGGILIEEGTRDFEVRDSQFTNIRGNALWTHSLFTSPQLADGAFLNNQFERIGRDAIQVGHAQRVNVDGNRGRDIGYPVEIVDVENDGTPVAIDTAGDVSASQYRGNQFDEVNGKCIDLDGFHDGLVRQNSCVNRHTGADYPHGHFGIVMNNSNPQTHSNNIEMRGNLIDGAKYGGLFVMGSGHQITDNRFENLNLAQCSVAAAGCLYVAAEPEMLASGIYLSRGVARKEDTRGNVIRGNSVTGHGIAAHCVVAGPGVDRAANRIERNDCRDVAP